MHSARRRFTVYYATAVALATASAGAAGAAEPRIELAGSPACAADPALLERRISGALIGTPDPDLHIELGITGASRLTVRITLLRGERALGSKEIVAASCDEALDAAIAVAALALSAPQPPVKAERSPPPSDAVDSDRESAHAELVDAMASHPDAARWRWLAGVGADHGSLPEPTLVLRVGTSRALGPGELRAFVWYGVPSIREEVGGALERTRSDFGSMALDYCLHLTGSRWLAACGGIEAGARRFATLESGANRERSEAKRIDATLVAAAGLALSYRSAFVQPALDISAQLPVAGSVPGNGPFGLRAVFGAALPF